MDPQNVQTIVSLYFDSVKNGENRHLIAQKYGKNLADATTADIELDAGTWFSGFDAAIKLVDPSRNLGLEAFGYPAQHHLQRGQLCLPR